MPIKVAADRNAAISTEPIIKQKGSPAVLPDEPSDGRSEDEEPFAYDARAARRPDAATAGRGTAFATFARVVMRAFAVKHDSSAESTRASTAGAVSRMTSETSEMIRNLARSSI